MLIVYIPSNYEPERKYIINVIFEQFLGITFRIESGEIGKIVICAEESEGYIEIPDCIFPEDENKWLTKEIMPQLPLEKCLIPSELHSKLNDNESIPVLYGKKASDNLWVKFNNGHIFLGIDVFGSAFFMLSRLEEYISSEYDEFGRFPAVASIAYKEGFLHRAIINEYLELLWNCIKYLWPKIKKKDRKYVPVLSHDVDNPFFAFSLPYAKRLRRILSEIWHAKDINYCLLMIITFWGALLGTLRFDIFNTFDYIMSISEHNGLKSAFYFMSCLEEKNARYVISNNNIKKLIARINKRGHEIGYHGSSDTFLNEHKTFMEVNQLNYICSNIGAKVSGGRQHFLLWKVPYTWRNWEKAGMVYDSTLSYADVVGFRAGVCYPFSVYDILERRALKLIEHPLIVMEGSLLFKEYMNFSYEQSLNIIKELSNVCRKYNGEFTLLWHNSCLFKKEERKLYKNIVKMISNSD